MDPNVKIKRLAGTKIAGTKKVASKDVIINPCMGVSARLFLPNLSDTPLKKLPILVYYYRGGFFVESPFSPLYNPYLTSLAAKASVLVVFVHYIKAPEPPLPAAYDDSLSALNWVVSHSAGRGPNRWLAKHGDFDHLFLAGDTAGANISHYVAIQPGVEVEGVVLVHPVFRGSEPTEAETEDPLINPLSAPAPSLTGLVCKKVVVFVAGKDFLKEMGKGYYEGLVGSGWGGVAELVEEEEGVDQMFHLFDPKGEKAQRKMEKMISFLNGE